MFGRSCGLRAGRVRFDVCRRSIDAGTRRTMRRFEIFSASTETLLVDWKSSHTGLRVFNNIGHDSGSANTQSMLSRDSGEVARPAPRWRSVFLPTLTNGNVFRKVRMHQELTNRNS